MQSFFTQVQSIFSRALTRLKFGGTNLLRTVAAPFFIYLYITKYVLGFFFSIYYGIYSFFRTFLISIKNYTEGWRIGIKQYLGDENTSWLEKFNNIFFGNKNTPSIKFFKIITIFIFTVLNWIRLFLYCFFAKLIPYCFLLGVFSLFYMFFGLIILWLETHPAPAVDTVNVIIKGSLAFFNTIILFYNLATYGYNFARPVIDYPLATAIFITMRVYNYMLQNVYPEYDNIIFNRQTLVIDNNDIYSQLNNLDNMDLVETNLLMSKINERRQLLGDKSSDVEIIQILASFPSPLMVTYATIAKAVQMITIILVEAFLFLFKIFGKDAIALAQSFRIFFNLGCCGIAIGCCFREGLGFIFIFAIGFLFFRYLKVIKSFLVFIKILGFTSGLLSFLDSIEQFANPLEIGLIPNSPLNAIFGSIKCTGNDFIDFETEQICKCSVANRGIYSNLPSCPDPTYVCEKTSDGIYKEVDGDTGEIYFQSPDKKEGCPRSLRILNRRELRSIEEDVFHGCDKTCIRHHSHSDGWLFEKCYPNDEATFLGLCETDTYRRLSVSRVHAHLEDFKKHFIELEEDEGIFDIEKMKRDYLKSLRDGRHVNRERKKKQEAKMNNIAQMNKQEFLKIIEKAQHNKNTPQWLLNCKDVSLDIRETFLIGEILYDQICLLHNIYYMFSEQEEAKEKKKKGSDVVYFAPEVSSSSESHASTLMKHLNKIQEELRNDAQYNTEKFHRSLNRMLDEVGDTHRRYIETNYGEKSILPNSSFVDDLHRNFIIASAGIQKKYHSVRLEKAYEKTYQRSRFLTSRNPQQEIDADEQFGVFGVDTGYLCPDGVNYVKETELEKCPRPEEWTVGVGGRYVAYYVESYYNNFDPITLFEEAVSCWNEIYIDRSKDYLDPLNMGALYFTVYPLLYKPMTTGTTYNQKKANERRIKKKLENMRFCFPLVPPWAPLPYFDYDFKNWIKNSCRTKIVNYDSVVQKCNCPQYYASEQLWGGQGQFLFGLPTVLLHRLYNSFKIIQFLYTRLPFMGIFDWTWRGLLILLGIDQTTFVVNLFNPDDADAGMSFEDNIFCVVLNVGSLYATVIFFVIPVIIIYYSFKDFIARIILDILGVFYYFINWYLNYITMMRRSKRKKRSIYFKEKTKEIERKEKFEKAGNRFALFILNIPSIILNYIRNWFKDRKPVNKKV